MQFDVFKNKNASSKERFPYLLDVQADLLSGLDTRMIIPLALRNLFLNKSIAILMPIIPVENEEYVAVTAQMAGIATRDLGIKIANVAEKRPEIIAAIDLLITGV